MVNHPPADITTVKSVKIDFGSLVMNTGDQFVLEWPMRAPVGAPTGQIAWNSFGYSATYPDLSADGTTVVQSAFLPSEPIKVGFEIQTPPPYAVGNFVWEDLNKNGIQDTGEPGINNVLVNLYTKVGSSYVLYDYTRTGFDQNGNAGYYTFPKVPVGTYRMEFVYPKTYTDTNGYTSTYSVSPYLTGSDRTIDSNGNPSTITNYTDLGVVKNSVLTPDFTVSTADDMSIDLGLYRLCSVGDYVWYDYNADGLQTGESGLAGVTVTLLDSTGAQAKYGSGSLVPAQTTTSTGAYLFTGLEPGVYKVQFSIPADYKISPANVGSDDTIDSDAIKDTGATATTANYTLLSGTQNLTVDAGLYLGHIGNLVFEDVNTDGIYNTGDLAVSGATVNLYKNGSGTVYKTTTTNSSGIYSFNDLPAATYVVEVIKPAAYGKFTLTSGTTPATDNDSDVDRTTGKTGNIVLAAGDRIDTIDAGLYKFASIGDYVWNDRNMNGTQNGGEPGIAGVNVKLTDNAGNPVTNGLGVVVADTTTDASGKYSFANLDPVLSKTYKVVFTNPGQNYKFSPNSGAITVTTNSDGLWTTATDPTATTGTITIASGSAITYVDQGMYLGHIGNLVFEDVNVDGVYNTGDTLINGATVNLYMNGSGTILKTTTTNSSGVYSFDDLFPGTYAVEFVRPAAYQKFTTKSLVAPDATDNDSDADRTTGKTASITITAGGRTDYVDAGMYRYASIGDKVWNDRNADGNQDAGEPGISGVTVRLTDAFGTPVTNGLGVVVADTTTDSNGLYSFTNLDPLLSKTYKVVFFNPGQAYKFSPNVGAITVTTNSDGVWTVATDPSATTGNIIVASNSAITYVDQGMYLGALGDFVWDDYNANGRQDAGEPGISGATVSLIDASTGLQAKNVNGVLIPATTTSAAGAYRFDDLAAGSYIVQFSLPAGWDKASPRFAAIATTATDSNADTATYKSDTVALTAGQRDFTIDAGFYGYAKLGDFIWNDLNANGIQDSGEPGIAGATVNLLDSGGNVVGTTTTNASGLYTFSSLIPGTYAIQAVMPTGFDRATPALQGSDTTVDSDLNTTTLKSANVTLISRQNNTTLDGGFYKFASIGDYVWEDVNGNGIQDTGEPGLSGVTVNLLNSSGTQLATTTTTGSGFYTFTSLVPGSYIIEVVKPTGYSGVTLKTQGSDTSKDSNLNTATARSDVTTLISGENNMTVDGGLYRPASIGDFVWNDLNANGIQDAGEAGVPNVTVNLLNSSGTQLATTTTNASGAYSFTNLIPGNYIIEVIKPSGAVSSPKTAGSDTTKDSNINIANSRSDVTALSSGENNMTIDAGLYLLASLGDFVWDDYNANGIQDAGEPGISGATVNLLDSGGTQIATTTTNASGIYSFTNLTPGTYTVQLVKPTGFDNLTAKAAGSDTAKDSNLNANLKSDPVTLVSGQNDPTIDAGFYKLASLGDFIWNDLNANGIQDSGEPGITGATVNLLNGTGTQIATTTTNASGVYSFTGLIPGTYAIQVVKPAGYDNASPALQGSDTTKDSNLDTTTLKSANVTLISGQNNTTVDGGFYKLASIGDFVWNDLNANGIQDTGEIGIPGATVNLLNSSGTQLATTTTNASGFYSFTNLVPGSYIIEVIKPAAYSSFSLKNQGGNTATDSNITPATSRSDSTTVISGENNMTVDAGMYKLASIGDFVWNDLNANGIQDAGEAGVPNVSVNLLNSSGTQLATTTTDAAGAYAFTGLTPGTYIIEVVKPSGYLSSPKTAGSDTTKDSNINIATSRSDAVTVVSGENNITIDAGIYQLATLGDFVWNDLNANGIQDLSEPGIAGATVNLLNNSGVQIATTTTNASGFYSFAGLTPGIYTVEVPKPAGFDVLTAKAAGSNTTVDSNLNANFRSDPVTLVSGQNDPTIDAGFYKLASLGDFVWNDLNANGIQDAGEPGIAGATVNLLDNTGTQIATTTTNASGIYTFTGLVPGTYAIQVVKPAGYDNASPATQGSDTTIDSNLNTTTLKSANVTLISGQNNTTIDGGFYKLASIGDFVWDDLNINGIQDTGEPGIAGVTVNLLNSSGTQISTTTTNASGFYSFTNLVPGAYIIEVIKPAAYNSFSLKNQGGNTATDSNITPATSRSDLTTIVSGENNMTVDAGMYKLASIGDFVWNDLNANGIQDAGEAGVPNVTVNLLNSSGTQLATTTTNAAGAYAFTALTPGTYIIEVVKPSGYLSSPKTAGSDTTKDSNINIATSRSDAVTVVSGENNMTIDAGIYQLASLGDFVWEDTNYNGIQDLGEPGIANTSVLLLNSLGVQIASTTTNASGFYSFAGLTPGTYTVEVPKPAGFDVITLKNVGINVLVDSNLNTNFKCDAVTLVSGENNPTIDAGFFKYASLGDFVWNDLNENGIQNAGEPGMAGVTVNLLNEAGVQVATTITDANGFYHFTSLAPGFYSIAVVRPTGYVFSPQAAGSDTSKDSNIGYTSARSDVVFLHSGENNLTVDAGLLLARPSIDIQKYVSFDNGTNWYDADTEPGPQYDPKTQPDPVFKFVVTNTGNVTLTDISVDDDAFGHISTITQLTAGEVWTSSIITQNYSFDDLTKTAPKDWINNQNVSLHETSSPKKWDFSAFPANPHSEGTWIVNGNYWNTGYYYYCGVIQPGETVNLPLNVLLNEELTTNEYQGATFYLQSKYDAIQITNQAVFDAWGMGFLPGLNKWLPTAYNNTNQRWEAKDNEVIPAKTYFWDMLSKVWNLIV